MKKQLYIVLGYLFVLLGTIGIFVPLLPTTPFLLLAIYFYINSSKKHLKRLLSNRVLGPYISSYYSRRGIPLKIKIRTLALLWVTIVSSIIWATDKLFVRIILAIVAVGVTLHIGSKRTLS